MVVGSQALLAVRRRSGSWRAAVEPSARRSTWPAAPAACSAPTTRSRSGTSGGEALRRPTSCCSPASRATSGSTTAARSAARPRWSRSTAARDDLDLNRKPELGVHADPGCSCIALAAELAGGGRPLDAPGSSACASATGRATPRSPSRPAADRARQPAPPLPRDRPRPGARQRAGGRRRRLRGHRRLHRAPARPALLARPRRLRHARRGRRLRPRGQALPAGGRRLDPLRRRLGGLQPGGVRHLRPPRHAGDRGGRQRRRLDPDRPRAGRDPRRRRGHRARPHRLPQGRRGLRRPGPAARAAARTSRACWPRRWRSRAPASRCWSTPHLASTEFRKGSISM